MGSYSSKESTPEPTSNKSKKVRSGKSKQQQQQQQHSENYNYNIYSANPLLIEVENSKNSKMSAVGIDIGNSKTTIAVARNRGIDIIVNEVSNRFTPTMAGFTNETRLLGEAAKTQEIMNSKNVYTAIKRLLGRRFDEEEVHSVEKKFINYEIVDTPSGEVGVKTTYQDVEQVFTMTQIVAMYFTQLKHTTENALNAPVTDVVISTPAYYTDRQLTALLNASEIAGLNCVRLLNESTSAALLYGITKARELPEKEPRHVCFVDVGESAMTVSVVAFTQAEANVKGTAFDRNLGGRNFDDVLVQHFAEEIKQKYKLDPFSNAKAHLRLTVACEKLKKILSANTKAPLHIENLTNELDVHSEITREIFENLSAHILDRVESPIRIALHTAGVRKDQIEFVELIGGTTRIPAIKERIQKFFERDNILSTTINADEAVARGCAFQCAMISPMFKVRDYNVKDVTPYDIKVTWVGANGEPNELDIFAANDTIPCTKALTFSRKEPFEFTVTYKDPAVLPLGTPLVIGRYLVNGVKPNKDGGNSDVKVKIRVNAHGVVEVTSAQLIEQVPVEETPMEVDDKAPAPAEEEAAPAAEGAPATDAAAAPAPASAAPKKAKVIKTDLTISSLANVIDKKEIELCRESEAKMAASDKLVFDTQLKKNALEEYIYDIRGKIETTHAEFIDEKTKEEFMAQLSAMEDWLYGDGENTTKSVYAEKLESLRAIGGPCNERYLENEERPVEEKNLRNAIAHFLGLAASVDEKYDHIEEAERNKLTEECKKIESWLNDALAKQATTPKHLPVVVTIKEIKAKIQQLNTFGNSIMNKPKPKPKESKEKETPPPPPADDENQAKDKMETEGEKNEETTPDPNSDTKPPAEMDLD